MRPQQSSIVIPEKEKAERRKVEDAEGRTGGDNDDTFSSCRVHQGPNHRLTAIQGDDQAGRTSPV
jgi:hypothetical protein